MSGDEYGDRSENVRVTFCRVMDNFGAESASQKDRARNTLCFRFVVFDPSESWGGRGGGKITVLFAPRGEFFCFGLKESARAFCCGLVLSMCSRIERVL